MVTFSIVQKEELHMHIENGTKSGKKLNVKNYRTHVSGERHHDP